MGLFSRRKKAAVSEDMEVDDVSKDVDNVDDIDDEDIEEDEPDIEEDDLDDDDTDEDEPEDEWALLDQSRDWRDDGPFDIDEVDLDADEAERLDLGCLIVTPDKGIELQLLRNPDAGEATHLMVAANPRAVMQITVFAAPVDDYYAGTIRAAIVAESAEAKVCEFAEGPFGTEIRRVMPVTDEQGREGIVMLRDWLVGGPRWVLHAQLLGEAAVDQQQSGVAAILEDFFRNIVVRRGSVAMAPGDPIPMTPPTKV